MKIRVDCLAGFQLNILKDLLNLSITAQEYPHKPSVSIKYKWKRLAVHAFNASLELLWAGGNCVRNHRRESRKTEKVSDT